MDKGGKVYQRHEPYSHLQTISEPTLGLLGGGEANRNKQNLNQEVVICRLKTEKDFGNTADRGDCLKISSLPY